MKNRLLSMLVVVALVVLTGCKTNIDTIHVSKVKMCKHINGNQCYNDRPTFSPSTPEIFVSCQVKNAPEKTRVLFSWFYYGQKKVEITSSTVNSGKKTGVLNLQSSLSKPNNGWPVGEYEIVINIVGSAKEPAVKKFTVQ